MLVLPGLVGLIVYILARPFDFLPFLRPVPFLYIFFFLAALGFVLDVVQGRLPWRPGPHLPCAIALVLWALFTVAARDSDALGSTYQSLVIPFSLYFLTAHGVANFRAFSLLARVFLACTLAISIACVYQGLQPFRCVAYQVPYQRGSEPVKYTGACATHDDCAAEDPDPALEFHCEKVGLAGSVSIGHGRVAYVGVLNDPNESALAVSIGIPFAIAYYRRRRSISRGILLSATVLLAATTVVMSESRGGQLVFISVLGVYFLRRYRWKGLLLAGLLGLPAIIYGGRTGGDAAASSQDRLGCLSAGIEMFRNSPILGVGYGQFVAHHDVTAHNSYVFAPAELGILGMTCWSMLVWISIKIALQRPLTASSDTEEASVWGDAMLATLVSFGVGVFFLTFNFHYLLWIVFGLAGAYHNACLNSGTCERVQIGIKDTTCVAGLNLTLLVVLRIYLHSKGL